VTDNEFCVRLLEQIDDLPNDLLPYVHGACYETRLRLAEADEAGSLFQEVVNLQAASPDSWSYNRVIVAEACRRGLAEPVVTQALDRLRQSPPDRERALEAKVLSLLCDIRDRIRRGWGRRAFLSIMVASIYGAAIVAAVLLKGRWPRTGEERPVLGYLAAGATAVVSAAILSVIFKSLLFMSF
jgi:hypothetical protein